MKFLVVLICLSINYFWKQDLDRFDDSWFFQLRKWVESRIARHARQHAQGWILAMAIVFAIPLVGLGAMLWVADAKAFGLFTIGIHILVLLAATDRTHPGMLVDNYLEHWRKGDFEACYLYLTGQSAGPALDGAVDNMQRLHLSFCRLVVHRFFEKMFVLIFWYLVAGPLAVLAVYICYQYRDGLYRDPQVPERDAVLILLAILEWLPLRLLGLTFCLVGDFESCFARFREMVLGSDRPQDEIVLELAAAALDLKTVKETDSGGGAIIADGPTPFNDLAVLELGALQALLERSQILWLCLLAAAAVLGVGI